LYFLNLPTQGAPARITLWWLPNSEAQTPTRLYLHGTFRNLEGNRHKINALRQAGQRAGVGLPRLGPKQCHHASEETIVADARLAWAELVRREPRPTLRVIYGHSMGSSVAVDLASELLYPSEPSRMKSCLFQSGVVVRRCPSYGYVASSGLASLGNSAISFCNRFDSRKMHSWAALRHQSFHKASCACNCCGDSK